MLDVGGEARLLVVAGLVIVSCRYQSGEILQHTVTQSQKDGSETAEKRLVSLSWFTIVMDASGD